jgi:hypothetical protein
MKRQDAEEQKRKLNCLILLGPAVKKVSQDTFTYLMLNIITKGRPAVKNCFDSVLCGVFII